MPPSRKLDFDDLLILCVQLLERHPAIATVVSGGCEHLLVDEFQVCDVPLHDLLWRRLPPSLFQRLLLQRDMLICRFVSK